MGNYRCLNCGYDGKSFIYQFADYTYCVATNSVEPEFISAPPKWVQDLPVGSAEIGEPVGCPRCHVWGVNNFESESPDVFPI